MNKQTNSEAPIEAPIEEPIEKPTEDSTDKRERFTLKDIIKIIMAATISLMSLAFVILICFSIYNNGLMVESILSMLLAFFSMFISIFFYFKADGTSTQFYVRSYEFMKEQSILLGRIEERFGEKFENLLSRIDHLDVRQIGKETNLDRTVTKSQVKNDDALDVVVQRQEEMETPKDDGTNPTTDISM